MFDFLTVGKAESFGFSAENPTGVRGGGTGKDCDKPSAWLKVAYGETITLVEVDGPGRIEHIWMTGDLTHHFILRIYWDGQDHPSVETPVSAFFGWAYDQNFKTADGQYPTLNSVMMLLSPGMSGNCYWPMPFHKHCRITLENRGLEPQGVYYMIVGHRGAQPADAGYFHASYRQQHPVTAGKAYTVIDGIQGAGRHTGCGVEWSQYLLG